MGALVCQEVALVPPFPAAARLGRRLLALVPVIGPSVILTPPG
ncbi:Unknown protein sequence [Pseudomonas amygdali pv. morsprunorum]|nr:Unknown protein sequence [Pseudomonas amygdali pv. morsprunorum]